MGKDLKKEMEKKAYLILPVFVLPMLTHLNMTSFELLLQNRFLFVNQSVFFIHQENQSKKILQIVIYSRHLNNLQLA